MEIKKEIRKGENELKLSFDILTIDHLGVKLYSTIPPMIAELVSNAWDADARNVYIELIETPKKYISVKDDGIGMSFEELNEHFLRVGRNRRVEQKKDTTPLGRKVLGKKGLGKLSMFGIGKKITVTTVKDGIKNSFIMDYDLIKACQEKEYKPEIIAYNLPTEDPNGTEILIESLSRTSKFNIDGLYNSLKARFHIYSKEFRIHINDRDEYRIEDNALAESQYQFKWDFPQDFEKDFRSEAERKLFDFGKEKKIEGQIFSAKTPLKKELQGVVLFSRGKLVQENKTFNSRGNDNFFQYMSGTFDVDFIDEDFSVDNCSTDRKSLAWDSFENNDLVRLNELLEKVVTSTQNKWRHKRKEEKKKRINELGENVDAWISSLNSVERPLAKKLTSAIIDNESISEETAAEYIGCIKDMYGFESFKRFTEKLDELQELDNESAIKLLTDWDEIEAKEYAKIAIGRIKAIDQFEKYIRTNASERDVIQKFLEEFPWLLDSKMSKFEREVTYTRMLKERFKDESFLPEENRRIDFLCTNNAGIVHVIELKRPNIKLTVRELQQIAAYVEFIKNTFPQSVDKVKGFLISDNMKLEPGADIVRQGLESQSIFVKSYSDLLSEARQYNSKLYNMYQEIVDAKEN